MVAFKLERMPQEKRLNAYPQILNLIRIMRGDPDLVKCVQWIMDEDYASSSMKGIH